MRRGEVRARRINASGPRHSLKTHGMSGPEGIARPGMHAGAGIVTARNR
ncbi:hypothetical protein EMIT0158MI4_50358 [Burkholderia ambifaria]